ncbi:hypothetical protein COCNU_scaffold003417G000040 [Cocos nucifera]|nr:hypothetical protein [Cocos nucifera]
MTFDPLFGSVRLSIKTAAAITISPPQATATRYQAAMAVTINPLQTAPSRETDSVGP